MHDRISRWRAGDNAAADELLRACAGRLERLARKMLRGFPTVRGQADTADVLQGACMRLLAALRAVRPETTREFFSLAGLQMQRELLDLARQASRWKAKGLGDDPAAPTDDDLELWARFHEAVVALPAERREVVVLIFYHG